MRLQLLVMLSMQHATLFQLFKTWKTWNISNLKSLTTCCSHMHGSLQLSDAERVKIKKRKFNTRGVCRFIIVVIQFSLNQICLLDDYFNTFEHLNTRINEKKIHLLSCLLSFNWINLSGRPATLYTDSVDNQWNDRFLVTRGLKRAICGTFSSLRIFNCDSVCIFLCSVDINSREWNSLFK